MLNGLKVDAQGYSNPGQKRAPHNEDWFSLHEPSDSVDQMASGSLYVVADGVGGAAAGERASRYAVEKVLYEYYRSEESDLGKRLKDAVKAANRDIFNHIERRESGAQMGTTLVAASLRGNQLIVANVGDSRAYLIRNGIVQRLTKDHSLMQKLIDEGELEPEEARNFRRKNVLMRSIGADDDVVVDIFDYEVQAGDILLLCSDGLHKYFWNDHELLPYISWNEPAESIARTLANEANQRGGSDNITAIVVKVGVPAAREVAREEMPTIAPTWSLPAARRPARLRRLPRPSRSPARYWLAAGGVVVALVLVAIGGVTVASTLRKTDTLAAGLTAAHVTRSTVPVVQSLTPLFNTRIPTRTNTSTPTASNTATPMATATPTHTPTDTEPPPLNPPDTIHSWCMKLAVAGQDTFTRLGDAALKQKWYYQGSNKQWRLSTMDPEIEPYGGYWYAYQIDAQSECSPDLTRWDPPTATPTPTPSLSEQDATATAAGAQTTTVGPPAPENP